MKKIYLLSLVVFIIDLISKILVQNLLILDKSYYLIPNFFYFRLTKNSGAAFSLFNNYRFILIILAIGVLIYICRYLVKNDLSKLESTSYVLLIGGILGNLFDRVFYGQVIDFIGFKIFSYYFPIFNIADIAIVIGALLLIIGLIRGGISGNKSRSK